MYYYTNIHFYIDPKRIPKNVVVIISDARSNGLALYADNKKCFDKLSKCPVQLPLPKQECEQYFLYEKLK